MSGRPRTVLVVDDNELNLELVTHVLEAAGHAVRQARSGPEALEATRREPPELILMDIGLPGMDGYTAVRTLKADPATARIPVVALTAYAMSADEQRALDSGCDGYITKPFNVRTLVRTLAQILEKPGPRS